MSETKTEWRAKLVAQAQARIEEALAQSEGPKRLVDIERLVSETTRQIGQELEAEILAERGAVSGPGPVCEGCGREMRYKGDKRRYVVTRNGEQRLQRGYYYCPDCSGGLFPPG
jgi:hypothetical protein